jgi:hypothetical protein
MSLPIFYAVPAFVGAAVPDAEIKDIIVSPRGARAHATRHHVPHPPHTAVTDVVAVGAATYRKTQ